MARNLRSGLRQSLKPTITGGFAANDLFTTAALDLNFAKYKNVGNLVDFTRASSGTYVGSDGLIKTATTNLLTYSEEFDQLGAGGWSTVSITAFGSGSIANATIAPDGALTADKIAAASGTNTPRFFQSKSGTGVHTFSVYAKAAEADCIFVSIYTGSTYKHLYYDLSNENIVSVTASDYSVVNVGNGWFRLSVTEITSNPFANISFGLSNAALANAGAYFLGDGTSGIYIWGAQLEQSSTVGEYIPTTSTINSAPRFDHDPTTGESLGLLVEEQRTNLLLRSEEFDQASWSKPNLTVSPNVIAASDGSLTADKLVDNTATVEHLIWQSRTGSNETTVASVYAKAAELSRFKISMSNFATAACGAYFDLTAGTVVATDVGNADYTDPFASIEAVGNGWYRCTFRVTKGSVNTTNNYALSLVKSGTNPTYTGDGVSGIYVWGAQLEEGSFPTSYIPTEGSTVTRAADVASISGSNFSSWYRQDEGTVFAEARHNRLFDGSSRFPRIASISDGTGLSTNSVELAYAVLTGNATVAIPSIRVAGALQANPTISGEQNGRKQALGYITNNVNAASGGQLGSLDTSASIPNVSEMRIGYLGTADDTINGTIKRIAFWPTRLPDSTLQGITQE